MKTMQPLANSRHGTLTLIMMLLVLISISIQTNATSSKKLDQTTLTTTQLPQDNTGIKCTAACSSCENLCGQQQFPPPLPPPPPPPKSPSTQNCNPVAVAPPPPRFLYITGPPGDLYPLDSYDLNFYSGAGRVVVVKGLLLLLVLCGVLQLLVFW